MSFRNRFIGQLGSRADEARSKMVFDHLRDIDYFSDGDPNIAISLAMNTLLGIISAIHGNNNRSVIAHLESLSQHVCEGLADGSIGTPQYEREDDGEQSKP
jgi:hypothetical protein